MTRVDLENSRERCMEVKAIYQTGCRKRGRHATRGPCGSSAGGADSVKRVGSRESEDRGQVLIWGSWRSTQMKGVRGTHCCAWMSQSTGGAGQEGEPTAGTSLFHMGVPHLLGMGLTACLWGCWGNRKTWSLKNLQYSKESLSLEWNRFISIYLFTGQRVATRLPSEGHCWYPEVFP